MGIKRLKCPVCGHNVSFMWNYFSLANKVHTCSNCKSSIGWYKIIGLYSFLCGILMFILFFLLVNFINSPYLAMLIAFIIAQIVFMFIPKRVRMIYENKEEIL
ncbi:MAG: hypothetical protein Q7J16_03225 [Candidatus Cloacimonadales bacterium]|nr:hypothetical protein [Candidatus Cloacimonadales bacterium]